MKIALAQTNITIGAFEETAEKIKDFCNSAKDKGCQLICFPELAITGYPPKDLLERHDFIKKAQNTLKTLLYEIKNIGVIIGTVTKNEKGVGKPLFNSAVFFKDGKILSIINKQLLPTYDVFDEARYFRPGKPSVPIEFNGYKIGITICEDIWNEPGLCSSCETYDIDPVEDLIKKGANFVINISSSPFFIGKPALREKYLKSLSDKYQVPFAYCNSIGGQDCLVFDGGSFATLPKKGKIAQGYDFKEDLVIFDLKSGRGQIRNISSTTEEEATNALILALRDYTRRCGIKKVTLGLSGGIDSSLTACLAVKALGKKNVLGVIMPSKYTSKESIEDAEQLSRNLDIKSVILPISTIFDSYLKELSPIFDALPPNVAEENIQARIRGNLLMAISNKLGHMVLSTGNKSELAVGYCTLYGDMSGGYALISDLPKTFVYKVAHFINTKEQLIPKRVFEKPPSAELRPGQTDQDDLPPYEILDSILELYLEKRLDASEIIKYGFNEAIVKKVLSMVEKNEYKRLQAPLGPKITQKAFCCGRRYPVAHGYRSF